MNRKCYDYAKKKFKKLKTEKHTKTQIEYIVALIKLRTKVMKYYERLTNTK